MKKIINRKLKVGVIGLGHQAMKDHIPAIKASSNIELTCVVEIKKKKLKDFLKENKNVKGYSTFDKLLKEQKPDFIIITLPHYLHCEVAKKAIKNKIHILKEKPLCMTIKEAKELQELADRNNIKVLTTVQRRFNPIYSSFLQLSNKIGNLFYIEGRYTIFTDNPGSGWRGKKKLAGGGCLIDMGYHMIDLLIWYFGLPDKVFAEMSCRAKEGVIYDAEDTAQVTFRYEKKKLWGSLLISRVIPSKQEWLNVYGTNGSIHLERGLIERYSTDGKLQEKLQRENSWPSAFQDQLEYFIDLIQNKRNIEISPKLHFNHIIFIESAYESNKLHKYVNTKDFSKQIL